MSDGTRSSYTTYIVIPKNRRFKIDCAEIDLNSKFQFIVWKAIWTNDLRQTLFESREISAYLCYHTEFWHKSAYKGVKCVEASRKEALIPSLSQIQFGSASFVAEYNLIETLDKSWYLLEYSLEYDIVRFVPLFSNSPYQS